MAGCRRMECPTAHIMNPCHPMSGCATQMRHGSQRRSPFSPSGSQCTQILAHPSLSIGKFYPIITQSTFPRLRDVHHEPLRSVTILGNIPLDYFFGATNKTLDELVHSTFPTGPGAAGRFASQSNSPSFPPLILKSRWRPPLGILPPLRHVVLPFSSSTLSTRALCSKKKVKTAFG